MKRAITALPLLLLTGAAEGQSSSWAARPWQPRGIASPQFESHPAFDASNRTLYLVRSSAQFRGWRLFQSRCEAGAWSDPEPPSFASKGGVEADPFLTNGGRTLYFISSRQDDGVKGRGLDLWRVDRASPRAAWGKPMRLSGPLNSASNEWFPRLARDGWIYFGSDRPGGFGATDIYRARHRRGRWAVENLGPGVNGSGDEYEAEISPDGRRMALMADGDLYLVTNTKGRWGGRTRLGAEINGETMEVGPLFSPSGRSLLFARDFGPAAGAGELVLATQGEAEAWPPACK